MARSDTLVSPFYPPRASRLGKRLTWLNRLRHQWFWRPLPPPHGARSWFQLLFCVLVPGLCFFQRGRRALGAMLFAGWIAAILTYLALLGIPGATLVYVLISSIHSLSATIAIASCFPADKADVRMWRASIVSFLVILVLYVVAQPFSALVMPFHFLGRTVLINPHGSVDSVQRGEWVSYRLANGSVAIDRVLALPGERIVFAPDSFSIAGVSYQRVSDAMPQSGAVLLGSDGYYIWPASSRTNAHYGQATAFLAQFAKVSREDIIAPAYRRWFWRKQDLDPLVPIVRNTGTPRASAPAITQP